ncbi:hypothetical protein I0E51_13165 [Pseudomonas lalucatii]|nr:hypothetical protein [Pseudomonas lalucatii]
MARDARLIGALAQRTPSADAPTGLGSLALPPQARDKPVAGTPLVIAIAPEEVYPLASIGPREKVTIVLHGAGRPTPIVNASSHSRPIVRSSCCRASSAAA